ncbi:MAG: nucleotidyltransferase family protein [Nitrospirae bacterium]|nr:MAG: nucleotidyltransferase family protein [Nitrospirota bacterium]
MTISSRLGSGDLGEMEAMELEQMLAAYSRVSSANKAKFARLKVVLQQFHTKGIDCLLLKGADLILRLYGVLGLRGMVDVDLLVHEEDLPAIDGLLRSLGYRTQIDGNPAYQDPESILTLDLITEVWYVDDQEVIWQRADQRDFEGIPVKGMGVNDLLVYLTAYNVAHRAYLLPSFARDIAFLVEKEHLDWAFILEEACRRHLKIPLHHGLSYVIRHTSTSIPLHVLEELAPTNRTERFCSFLLNKLVTEQPIAELGHLLLFLTQPARRKGRWLKNSLFPSKAFMTNRYGEEWARAPLATRLGRPFSLASQSLRLSSRLAVALLTRRNQ